MKQLFNPKNLKLLPKLGDNLNFGFKEIGALALIGIIGLATIPYKLAN